MSYGQSVRAFIEDGPVEQVAKVAAVRSTARAWRALARRTGRKTAGVAPVRIAIVLVHDIPVAHDFAPELVADRLTAIRDVPRPPAADERPGRPHRSMLPSGC